MTDNCRQTFHSYEGEERQRRVFEDHGGFDCESHECSEYSPGPVLNDENLIFLLINPTHFDDETGLLSPIAFQEVHRRDLSVFRRPHVSGDELKSTIADLVERGMTNIPPKVRRIDKFCSADARDIRSLTDEDKRSFGVYDTALEVKPSHASVFTRPDILDSRMKRAQARKRLHEVFGKNINDASEIHCKNERES